MDWPQLNVLLQHYRNRDFIATDPMRLAHRVRHDPVECEAVAFLSAMLSYGRRESIIAMLEDLVQVRLGGNLLTYLQRFDRQRAQQDCSGFVYRFNTADDVVWLLECLAHTYQRYGTLERLWLAVNRTAQQAQPIGPAQFTAFVEGLVQPVGWPSPLAYGARYLLPLASRGGACKRLWLFLRWVVRTDEDLPEPVDFGLWRTALQPNQLLMPVDTHVARLSREWGLVTRRTNDWQTAETLTAALRVGCPQDPVRYDFAFLGYGVEQARQNRRSPRLN